MLATGVAGSFLEVSSAPHLPSGVVAGAEIAITKVLSGSTSGTDESVLLE